METNQETMDAKIDTNQGKLEVNIGASNES
jgi:hypothetical protein